MTYPLKHLAVGTLLSAAFFFCASTTDAADQRPLRVEKQTASEIIEGMTDAQRHTLQRQVRISLARHYAKEKDILNWGRMLFPEKFTLPFCEELHGYFVSIRGEERTSTEAPRGHAKTTVKCFLIPIFQALEEPETFRHYLNVQETGDKAVDVNTAIRMELEENDLLREIYGDQVTAEKWTDKKFVLANGVVFSAIGAGQSIRGINYRNVRPDYILIDDLYGEDDINNIESTSKKNDWFWGSLYKARAIGRRTSVHLQGTAINSEDMLEGFKNNPKWRTKTFRQVKDFGKGIVLWEALQTFKQVIAEKEGGIPATIWARECQNERKDDSQSIVKRSWLEGWEYDPEGLTFDEHFKLIEVALGCDPSVGKKGIKKTTSDPTAIITMLIAKHDDSQTEEYYITHLVNDRLSQNERIGTLNRLHDSPPDGYAITRAYLEGQGGFGDFVAEARRRTPLRIKEVTQSKDKLAVLELRSHHFESQRVHISTRIPKHLRDALFHQLTTNFPKHDDLRDAILLPMRGAKKRSRVWEVLA